MKKELKNCAVFIVVAAMFVLTAMFAAGCGSDSAGIKIGHGGGYLSAALYAAQKNFAADYRQFRSSSDIGYSLLSGVLDAGFVEAEKLAAFAALDGFERLTVVGKVTYPYGSTLILRKGLNLRLHELDGLTIAASDPHCDLLEEFVADAGRFGADISGVDFVYMPFHTMLSALEARTVDAAVIRGSYAVVALHEGHSVLYQNWEMEPGDGCCPAVIEQAMLVLLARRDKLNDIEPFVAALASAQKLSPDELRRAVANNTVIPFELLQSQPVPEFSTADDELAEIFVTAARKHHGNHHARVNHNDHGDHHARGNHHDHENHHDHGNCHND